MAVAEVYSTMGVVRNAYLFKIPPKMAAQGYSADDWDRNNPIWNGRIRIVATKKEKCELRFENFLTENEKMDEFFLIVPYNDSPPPETVQRTYDSSRFFALAFPDPSGKKYIFLGLGFNKKEEATDFNMALSEWERMKHQRAEIASKPAYKDTGEFALDSNTKLTINDRFSKKTSTKGQNSFGGASGEFSLAAPPSKKNSFGGPGGEFSLAAPPSKKKSWAAGTFIAPPMLSDKKVKKKKKKKKKKKDKEKGDSLFDDFGDFGNFQSAEAKVDSGDIFDPFAE